MCTDCDYLLHWNIFHNWEDILFSFIIHYKYLKNYFNLHVFLPRHATPRPVHFHLCPALCIFTFAPPRGFLSLPRPAHPWYYVSIKLHCNGRVVTIYSNFDWVKIEKVHQQLRCIIYTNSNRRHETNNEVKPDFISMSICYSMFISPCNRVLYWHFSIFFGEECGKNIIFCKDHGNSKIQIF